MTRKTYRPWSPDQPYLVPPTPRDWLPEGHLAYFLLDVVAELDLSAIDGVLQSRDPRGQRPYDPRMMVALLLYAYCTGTFSSRRIARGTYDDVAMRFISGDQHPHFTCVAGFRRRHLEALGGLFRQVVQLCARAGLVQLGHVAIDGTKIQANASKHKAMSYGRMKQEEARLTEEIAALLAKAEATDDAEDRAYGAENSGDELPEELRRRESRLARIREAKAALEQEAREARAARLRELAAGNERRAEEHPEQRARRAAETNARKQKKEADELDPPREDDSDDGPPPGPRLPFHRPKAETDGTPKPKAQRNFTDPDSRIMKGGGGAFVQGYNAQAAVDEGHQIIVGCVLSNQPPDIEYLAPVLAEVAKTAGALPSALTADAGYWSEENDTWCAEHKVEAYISTSRTRHGPAPPATAVELPDSATPRERMAAKVATERGREMYRRRKFTVEPVFGQIKEARGFRRFLLRGLGAVQQEWALVCATHNLLKLFRSGAKVPAHAGG